MLFEQVSIKPNECEEYEIQMNQMFNHMKD